MSVEGWIALIIMVAVVVIGLCYSSGDNDGRGI